MLKNEEMIMLNKNLEVFYKSLDVSSMGDIERFDMKDKKRGLDELINYIDNRLSTVIPKVEFEVCESDGYYIPEVLDRNEPYKVYRMSEEQLKYETDKMGIYTEIFNGFSKSRKSSNYVLKGFFVGNIMLIGKISGDKGKKEGDGMKAWLTHSLIKYFSYILSCEEYEYNIDEIVENCKIKKREVFVNIRRDGYVKSNYLHNGILMTDINSVEEAVTVIKKFNKLLGIKDVRIWLQER